MLQSFVGMAMTAVKAGVTTDMNSQLPSLSALVFFKVIFADFGSSFFFFLVVLSPVSHCNSFLQADNSLSVNVRLNVKDGCGYRIRS